MQPLTHNIKTQENLLTYLIENLIYSIHRINSNLRNDPALTKITIAIIPQSTSSLI